jgi:hypothetical protein
MRNVLFCLLRSKQIFHTRPFLDLGWFDHLTTGKTYLVQSTKQVVDALQIGVANQVFIIGVPIHHRFGGTRTFAPLETYARVLGVYPNVSKSGS